MRDEGKAGLRCRPGDLARIKEAWNELLRGSLVLIQYQYSRDRWMTLLLDEPALTLNEDYTGFVATRRLIAADDALIPLADDEADAALATIRTIALLPRDPEKAASLA